MRFQQVPFSWVGAYYYSINGLVQYILLEAVYIVWEGLQFSSISSQPVTKALEGIFHLTTADFPN